MKIFSLICLLCTVLITDAAARQTATPGLFQSRTPLAQLTTIASKCDISACQQNCYVSRTRCKIKDNGGCSTQAQMCVQACTSQCQ